MAPARLTNNIRGSLQRKLLERAFQERAQDMVQRQSDFAREVYKEVFRKDLEKIASLPDGWLAKEEMFSVELGGEVVSLSFTGLSEGWALPDLFRKAGAQRIDHRERFPFSSRSGVLAKFDGRHLLTQRHRELSGERSDLLREMNRSWEVMSATLNSVSTIRKLIEVWPEVEAFALPYLKNGEQRALLPDIPRAELNTSLRLPPQETVN